MFDHVAPGKFESIVKWHKTMLKPRCDVLISLQFSSSDNEDEKEKQMSLFKKLLEKADEMLLNI